MNKVSDDALDARVKRLEDLEEIAQLRATYCHYLDGREWRKFVELFTLDGRFEGLEAIQGQAALFEFFSKKVPSMQEHFWHFCSNGTTEVSGDSARGRISMEFLSVTDGVSYVSAGHYDDVFQRVSGAWRFASRHITFYYYNRLSEGFVGYHPPKGLRRDMR